MSEPDTDTEAVTQKFTHAEIRIDEIGEVAYVAYADTMSRVDNDGTPIQRWGDLPIERREAFRAAATAVANMIAKPP